MSTAGTGEVKRAGTRGSRPGGRPTRLTPEIQAALVRRVEEVGFLSTAARLEGLPVVTVQEWWQRGLGRDQDRPTTPQFAGFARSVERARALNVERRKKRIEEAAQGGYVVERSTETRRDGSVVARERVQPPDWRADAWALERLDRELYGAKAPADGTLTVKHGEALLEVLDLFVRRYVPRLEQDAIVVEIGRAVDTALGIPSTPLALPAPRT